MANIINWGGNHAFYDASKRRHGADPDTKEKPKWLKREFLAHKAVQCNCGAWVTKMEILNKEAHWAKADDGTWACPKCQAGGAE